MLLDFWKIGKKEIHSIVQKTLHSFVIFWDFLVICILQAKESIIWKINHWEIEIPRYKERSKKAFVSETLPSVKHPKYTKRILQKVKSLGLQKQLPNVS